jgi:transcriptional regulator with XRE-family HTH domain
MTELLTMSIGDRLKSLRTAKGLSQVALARASGLSLGVVTQMEQGLARDPRISTVLALAEALGCSLDDLARDPPPKPTHKPKRRGK